MKEKKTYCRPMAVAVAVETDTMLETSQPPVDQKDPVNIGIDTDIEDEGYAD